jgi:xanthine/CO dehydrogenase XdhC/CoxF family maturation factor
MLDLAGSLTSWYEQGRAFAVATVIAVQGSAPHQPGAAMAGDADGTVIGSISGGCVESAVFELCQEALKTGRCRCGCRQIIRPGHGLDRRSPAVPAPHPRCLHLRGA